jgi:hypothetical protein
MHFSVMRPNDTIVWMFANMVQVRQTVQRLHTS